LPSASPLPPAGGAGIVQPFPQRGRTVVQALRAFAAFALLALAPGTATADSGRASDRAGQKAEPNRATQELRREIRARRFAVWMLRMKPAEFRWDLLPWSDFDGDAEARNADPPR
jgi:hypothetical protein